MLSHTCGFDSATHFAICLYFSKYPCGTAVLTGLSCVCIYIW